VGAAFYYGTTYIIAESILGMLFAHVGVAFVCQEDYLHTCYMPSDKPLWFFLRCRTDRTSYVTKFANPLLKQYYIGGGIYHFDTAAILHVTCG
jgi:hypothetical protein